MYTTGGHLPVDAIPRGTTLLCHGPPMTGKRDLCLRLLAAGGPRECAVVVGTDTTARALREEYAEYATEEAVADRLAIVDCTGESAESDSQLVHVASSPADLTGAGVGTTNVMETLHSERGCDGYRVGLCSLTSMFLYAEAERVLKFTHVLTQRIREAGALAVVVLQPGSVDRDAVKQVQTFVDGTVELREADDGSREVRLRGVPDAPDEWYPVEDERPGGVGRSHGDEGDATDISDGDWTADAQDDDNWLAGAASGSDYDSLSAIVDAVERQRPTLSVYNYHGDGEPLAALERHCERMNVAFREGALDEAEPTDVAMLHRGSDLIDAAPVQTLFTALDVAEAGEDAFAVTEGTDMLADLSQSTFGARGASKQFLIDVSHVIETEAWRTGEGRLYAGFQEFSRLWDDPEARRIYRRLADSGVEVHVYGVPDTDPPGWDGLTVHGVEDDEIATAWFVAYDGGGDAELKATLLAEERGPDTYSGFWTYQAERTDETIRYLRSTYGEGERTGPASDRDTTTP